MFEADLHPVTVALIGLAVFLTGLGIRVAALGIIPGNRKPSTGMAWLLAILLNPALGMLAFALFGRTRLEKRRYVRQREAYTRIQTAVQTIRPDADAGDRPPYVASVTHLNQRLGALPLVASNDVELFED
jgi:cardiolipin synthase